MQHIALAIANNHALESLRKDKRGSEMIATDNIIDLEAHLDTAHVKGSTGDTPERALIRNEERRLLERRIDDLPAALRTVFVMRALEELSVEETAECLGIPEATVRARYFRARQLLRNSLAPDLNNGLHEAFAFDGERCDRIVRGVKSRLGTAR